MMIEDDPYVVWKYRQIVDEQLEISYSTKGITFTDTEYMSYYERTLVLNSIREIKKKEVEAFGNSQGG